MTALTLTAQADAIRRLLGDIEAETTREQARHEAVLREVNDLRRSLAEHYEIACEIIAAHLGSEGTGRAKQIVERQYRLRNGLVEEASP